MLNGWRYQQQDFKVFCDNASASSELGSGPYKNAPWPSGYLPGGQFFCCNNRVNKSREQRTSNRPKVIPLAEIEIVSGRCEGSCGRKTLWRGLNTLLAVKAPLASAFRCDLCLNKIVLRKGARGISPQRAHRASMIDCYSLFMSLRGAMRNLSKKNFKNLFSYDDRKLVRENDSSGSTVFSLDPFHLFSLGKAFSITTKSVNYHKIVSYSHG